MILVVLITALIDAFFTALVFHNKTKEQKKNSLFLFFAGMFPFSYLLFLCVITFKDGTGLFGVNNPYDFESVIFAIVFSFIELWFIFIPSFILIIISLLRLKKKM